MIRILRNSECQCDEYTSEIIKLNECSKNLYKKIIIFSIE